MIKILKPVGVTVLSIGFAILSVAISIIFVIAALMPIIDMVFNLSPEHLSLVRRVCMIFAFAGGYWLYVHFIEKRAVSELAFRPVTIGVSGLLGAALIAIPLSVLYVSGAISISGFGSPTAWVGVALPIIALAMLEETIFRGIIFRIVQRNYGFWAALILPSILFSAMHLLNDNWAGWLSITTGILLGMLWTLVYAFTQNIWAAAANHALWNFTIFASGLPLTGQSEWQPLAPLQSEVHASDMWTGGAAGPEESILVIASVACTVAVLIWIYVKRGKHVGAAPVDS
jgi:membrane protease YdiL (CAAX protease family)